MSDPVGELIDALTPEFGEKYIHWENTIDVTGKSLWWASICTSDESSTKHGR